MIFNVIGQLTLTAGGYALGGPIGGAVGGALGGALFSDAPDVQGPRLGDLSVQLSAVGASIPIVYGTYPVSGNIFWSTEIEEVADTDEVGGLFGIGGQDVTTYRYYGNFALGLCEGPIAGVRRIWANEELVYDVRAQQSDESEDDYLQRLSFSASFGSYMTTYLGTEAQTAPELLETHEGAGQVPGFRGLAYLLFERLPLERYGNRLPQLRVEVVTQGTAEDAPEEYANEVLYAWVQGRADPQNCRNDHEYRVDYLNATGESAWFDDIADATAEMEDDLGYNARLQKGWMTGDLDLISPFVAVDDGERVVLTMIYSDEEFASNLYAFEPDEDQSTLGGHLGCSPLYEAMDVGDPPIWWNNRYIPVGEEEFAYGTGQPYRTGMFYLRPVINETDPLPGYFTVNNCVSAFGFSPDSQAMHKRDGEVEVRRVPRAPDNPCAPRCDPAPPLLPGGEFCVLGNAVTANVGWALDDARTYKVLSRYNESGGIVTRYPRDPALPEGHADYDDESFWTDAYDAAVAAGELPAGLTYSSDGTGGVNTYPRVQNFAYTRSPYIPTLAPSPVKLSDIVSDLCGRAGLSEHDVSDLESTDVHGYAVGQVMTARDAIQPLRRFDQFDGGEIDGQIIFVKRGGPSVLTLDADDLGAHEAGASRPPAVVVERTQDVELPRKLRVHYRSIDRDYEAGEQYAARLTTDAVQIIDVDIPVAMTDSRAAQIAEILLYEAWTARNVYDTAVSISHLALSPTDAITLPVDGQQQRARILHSDYQPAGMLRLELVRDDEGAYVSYAVGNTGEHRPPILSVQGPTEMVLMNLPALADYDDRPGYFAAMYGPLANWDGGKLYRSSDGGATFNVVAVAGAQATVGTANAALPDALTTVWDRGNELEVTLVSGALSSAAESAVLDGANVWALEVTDDDGNTTGWEIGQSATVALAGGVYTLTDHLRGRRGTEWAVGQHKAGDRFVMLSNDGIVRVPMDAGGIGEQRAHRAASNGVSPLNADSEQFAGAGVALECFSPAHLSGTRVGGDLIITFLRRDRMGEELTPGEALPMSESAESYEVDVLDGSTVIRTLSSTSESATYTGAQQSADWGSPIPSTFTVRVYQISATVGRGYPAEATL